MGIIYEKSDIDRAKYLLEAIPDIEQDPTKYLLEAAAWSLLVSKFLLEQYIKDKS